MIIVTFDPSAVNERLRNMEKQIAEVGSFDMPAEMQAWQDEEFNRIKPNQQWGTLGRRAVFVSTKFWGRKMKPTHVTAGYKRVIKSWILRPQKTILLYQRMVALARRKLVWSK